MNEYGIWMPLTVKSLSNRYSNSSVGFLVMIPYLMALLAMILVSRSSDRKLERRYHAAIPLTIGGIALMLLGTAASPSSSIPLLSFAAMGIYSFMGPFWTMPGEFLTGYSAASGIALITSIANLGGFVGPYAIGAISEPAAYMEAWPLRDSPFSCQRHSSCWCQGKHERWQSANLLASAQQL